MTDRPRGETSFKIFRAADAPSLEEAGIMNMRALSQIVADSLVRMGSPGISAGEQIRVLMNVPGFSLVHAWFKKGYPLPLHAHNSDCLYYVIAGSLRLGSETLGPGDGVFIPKDVPYSYTPGPEGVEVLEFRHVMEFDIDILARGGAFWQRADQTVADLADDWANAKRPVLNG